ncbi:MAG: hypothetical protein LC541_01120 [Candidatus Thiodiazotropha sp.]|nr:hypothetical protein [Candidatus Thiodiazotropha sp.]MCM8881922.1 hypothetical protein [Candidatus Thiodiazotropha sp.]MCM8918589.1 hypothetical protein [Candidatus Thiodiazotropha sp.]
MLYTQLAETPNKKFGWGKRKENAWLIGYGDDWLNRIPDDVWKSTAVVGNPFSVMMFMEQAGFLDIKLISYTD